MEFSDQTGHWLSGFASATEGTVGIANTTDSNDGFFMRPIKIGEFSWNVGESVTETFDPWSLFFEDSRVINRLAHFKNLRCKLHVKFLLNGNAFYYGRLIAAYNPLPQADERTAFRMGVTADLVEASQRPHVYLDPTTSTGGELELDFIFPKNAVDIPLAEWDRLGNISLGSMNTLRHANGGVDPITITIFAYASDVNLSTPTSITPLTITPQGMDEYTKPSTIAHTLANWSGKLANAPFIGKYARATQMISDTFGNVASLFGFSRAPDLSRYSVIPRYFKSLANTNATDYFMSLALDQKKEVTIDPTVCGFSSEDEMALVPLAMKESYLDSFTWVPTAVPETHLFSIRVNPTQIHAEDVDGNAEIHMTPSAWVSAPFRYWTGSMDFRFQVVCSAYHKGRLRFVWDPDYNDHGKSYNYNMNYSEIVDITEAHDFITKIGWGQQTNYLEVPTILGGPYTSTVPYSSKRVGCNGVLSVYVVNELTSPASPAEPIEVNVFSKMCDDFEVACPTSNSIDKFEPLNYIQPNPPLGSVVLKTHFPNGVVFADGEGNANTPQMNVLGNAFSRQQWQEGRHDYKIQARGPTGGGTYTFDFKFVNPSANARDITLTFGGNVTVGTLAGFIGAELTMFVPDVFVPEGVTMIPFVGETNQGAGRVQLEAVTSTYGTFEEPEVLVPTQVIDLMTNSDKTLEDSGTGSYQKILATSPYNFNAPADHVSGTELAIVTYDVTTGTGGTFGNGPTNDQSGVIANGVPSGGTISFSEDTSYGTSYMYYWKDTSIQPQGMAEETTSGEEVQEISPPELESVSIQMGPTCECGPMNSVYFGEQASSWRQLLKRYQTQYILSRKNIEQTFAYYVSIPLYPYTILPISETALDLESTSAMSIFDWCAPAYMAMRGSTRINVFTPNSNATEAVIASRYSGNWIGVAFNQIVEPRLTFTGSQPYRPEKELALDVEVPYYNQFRFVSPRTQTQYDLANFNTRDGIKLEFPAATPPVSKYLINYAIGEDFSLSGFLCTPIVMSRF